MNLLRTMSLDNIVACIAVLVSATSVITMSLQTKSNVTLNRNNQTFKKIEELDEMLYRCKRLKNVIKEIRLLDDHQLHRPIPEAAKILDKYDENIYEILNFFESLSLSASLGNINVEILRRIYSPRICNAYEKLTPFINVITDKYEDQNKKPYQHFSELYKLFCELNGGENGHRNGESSFEEKWRNHRIYRKYKFKLHTK